MSFTNFLAAELLDHFMNDGAYTAPTNIFVALSSTTPTEAGGNITEPSGGSYARVSTAGTDWNAATVADPSLKDNLNAITFPAATADWVAGANLTYFVLFDASSAGNALAFGALTVAKPVLNGDTASFAAGALDITLD